MDWKMLAGGCGKFIMDISADCERKSEHERPFRRRANDGSVVVQPTCLFLSDSGQ